MTDLVMFDIDGTLTTFATDEEDCFNQAIFEALGINNTNNDWENYRNMTDSGLITEIVEEHLKRQPTSDEIDRVEKEFVKRLKPAIKTDPKSCKPIAGSNNILQQLRRKPGTCLAIATGNWLRVAELKLNSAQLKVDDIPMATSNDAESRADIMKIAEKKALRQRGHDTFAKITYFGDGLWDAKASQHLGYEFIGISTRQSKQILLDMGAVRVYPDFTNYKEILDLLMIND